MFLWARCLGWRVRCLRTMPSLGERGPGDGFIAGSFHPATYVSISERMWAIGRQPCLLLAHA